MPAGLRQGKSRVFQEYLATLPRSETKSGWTSTVDELSPTIARISPSELSEIIQLASAGDKVRGHERPQHTSEEIQMQQQKLTNFQAIAKLSNADGSDNAIALFHWLGVPNRPEKTPVVCLHSDSSDPDELGSRQFLTADEARRFAAKLVEAADKLDEGWR